MLRILCQEQLQNGPGNLEFGCVLLSIYSHIPMYTYHTVFETWFLNIVSTAEESRQQMGETK